jgi:hypothetical protein
VVGREADAAERQDEVDQSERKCECECHYACERSLACLGAGECARGLARLHKELQCRGIVEGWPQHNRNSRGVARNEDGHIQKLVTAPLIDSARDKR